MTRPNDRIPEDGAVKTEAQAWVRHLQSGEATRLDLERLEQWRALSHTHAHAFAEAALMWTTLGEAARKATTIGTVPYAANAARRGRFAPGRRAFLIGGGALAASVAGALVVRQPLDLWPSLFEMAAGYRTRAGERRRIEVASAAVELNTRTAMDLRADSEFELLDGEAAVSTTEGAAQRVAVVAGNGRTSTMGASFNIRKNDRLVRVTCVTGEVSVRCGSVAATVRSGQQVSYDEHGLAEVAVVDAGVVTAWQRGVLIFRRVPLGDVIDEVNRYRSGRIVLLDRRLGQRLVVASFQLDRIDEVIGFISKAMSLSTTTLPGGVVLVS